MCLIPITIGVNNLAQGEVVTFLYLLSGGVAWAILVLAFGYIQELKREKELWK